jgi:flagellar biosynthesis protein FliQ
MLETVIIIGFAILLVAIVFGLLVAFSLALYIVDWFDKN